MPSFDTSFLTKVFAQPPFASSLLQISVVSLAALAICVTGSLTASRLTNSLLSVFDSLHSTSTKTIKQDTKSNKQKPTSPTKDSEFQEPSDSSLFPSIVYENIAPTNENIVACATGKTFSYVPVHDNAGSVSWDLTSLDEPQFMFDQTKIPMSNISIDSHSFTSCNTSSSSSPMLEDLTASDTLYDSLNFDINPIVFQVCSSYPLQQDLPIVDYSVTDKCYTPPGLTPQNVYSSSPDDSNLFPTTFADQSVMLPMDSAANFIQNQSTSDLLADAISLPPQVLPNGVYPASHSRSNSDNGVQDYSSESDKAILSPANIMSQFNFETFMSSDHFYIQPQTEHQLDQSNQQQLPYGNMTSQYQGQPMASLNMLSPVSDFTSPTEQQLSPGGSSTSIGSHNGLNNNQKQVVAQPFRCPHCPSSFRLRGYLTRHMKKHATKKAYSCPFYSGSDRTPCHPSGGFSRRDTYKTHLKARHFLYPSGTRSENRGKVAGVCSGCGMKFNSNEKWVEEHIHNRQCPRLSSEVQEGDM